MTILQKEFKSRGKKRKLIKQAWAKTKEGLHLLRTFALVSTGQHEKLFENWPEETTKRE